MSSTTTAFDFVDGERSYTCQVAPLRRDGAEAWWWFGVSGDRNRYAPFRAETADTEATVRARVVAYYEERIAPRVWTNWRDRHAQKARAT
jgi:hypothetical protein